MRTMIYADDLLNKTNELSDMISNFGNISLTDAEKIALSEKLAETCLLIRVKYEIVSRFYFNAEVNADKKIGRLMAARNIRETLDAETETGAKWILNGRGLLECSKCHSEGPVFYGNSIPKMTRFCPNCANRMRNGV